MLATRKMKNTTMKVRCRRCWLARKNGRIISMAAPVVPIHEASTVPTTSMRVLTNGVPERRPESRMPPETVYRDQSRMMNGT